MNKLTALSKLASAYWELSAHSIKQGFDHGDALAMDELAANFGRTRRSLTLEDLKPQPKSTEGLNPKGPSHF